jgi:hypothetical protein
MPGGKQSPNLVLKGVCIFQAGEWKGTTYTVRDLDDMVKNFRELKDTLDPPAVIGHEEEQDWTGIPAVGWVERVWRVGPKLYADISQVFPAIADLIAAGAYRKLSVEIYDEAPEGIDAEGKVLRRVAFLGGELPHLKSLGDLPQPAVSRYGESPRELRHAPVIVRLIRSTQNAKAKSHTCYAEVEPMDRAALEAQLKSLGWTEPAVAALASLSDEDLQKLVMELLAQQAGTAPAADAPATAAEWPEGVTRETVIADLVAAGVGTEEELSALSDDELLMKWNEWKASAAPADAPMSEKPVGPATPQLVAAQFSELQRRAARLEAQVKQAERMQAQRQRAEKAVLIDTYCEQLVKDGFASPAQVEKARGKDGKAIGPVRCFMESCSAVAKFGEKSALEQYVATLRSGQPRKFGEQMPDPAKASKVALAKKMAEELSKPRKTLDPRTLEERFRVLPLSSMR